MCVCVCVVFLDGGVDERPTLQIIHSTKKQKRETTYLFSQISIYERLNLAARYAMRFIKTASICLGLSVARHPQCDRNTFYNCNSSRAKSTPSNAELQMTGGQSKFRISQSVFVFRKCLLSAVGKRTRSSKDVQTAPLSIFRHIFLLNLQRLDIIHLVNPFVFATNICTSLPTENGFAWLSKCIRWIRHICRMRQTAAFLLIFTNTRC